MVTKVPLGTQISGTSDDITEGSVNLFLSVSDQAKIDNLPADTTASIAAVQADVDANQVVTDAHIADTANPHSVTKTQVGLGNVDNTSDANKPVSSATQTALDAKQPDIQFKDEGSNVGTSGGVSTVNFTGSGVTASESGGTLTVNITGGSGSGDVVGPASATDDNIATFDSTTGKLIQDGGATIAQVRDRSTHTGTQTASTISNFDVAVADEIGTNTDRTGYAKTTGRDQSEFVFTDGTRTVTVQPKAPFTEFDVWIGGTKYTYSTPQSVVISNTEGNHYIYFDATGTLVSTTTFDIALIYSLGYTASVYWSTSASAFIIHGDERHGVIMDYATHTHFHRAEGTKFYSGLGLESITADGTGNNNSDATIGVANGVIADEDIIFNITSGSPQTLASVAQIPVLYKSGASGSWLKSTATNYPLLTTGTGRMAYNLDTAGTWSQAEVTNNNYALTHIFATNDVLEPIMAVQGQAQYSNVALARAGATTEMNSLVLTGLPSVEWKSIGTIIYQTSNTYTNAVKSRIRTTDAGGTYIDWRYSAGSPATGVSSDHGNLSGLTDDDHTQYALTCATQTAINSATYTFAGTEARNTGYMVTYSSGSCTINLDADLFSTGWEVSICKGTNDANTVTIDAQTGNNINGSQTYVLTTYNEVVTLLKDGANTWKIKNKYEGANLVRTSGATFTGDVSVPDEAYGAGWNGSVEVPTKNAVYDKVEALPSVVFKTISVSGQSDVVADSATDTLTLVGSGVTITTDASTDTITFTASGGAPKEIRIRIPGELVADTANYQGVFWRNNTGATVTISNVSFAVAIAAAGSGAAAAFNVYKSSGTASDGINTSAVNLFTSAVDLTTTNLSATNSPNTATVESGRWVSLRCTSSAGATNKASDAEVIITYS